ncbi:MAG: RnfABCDGE type electron transport complex subunit D [Rikenellaceae bacterium]|nr:RnfABCDGE type electron transport complex subunit D [Rikenellaceae bacterium]
MNKKFIISPSPHIHGHDTTSKLMRDVLIALIPAFAVSVVVFGVTSIVITAVAVAACILFEYLIQKFLIKGPGTICNLSAVLTGVLLAFNMPPHIPLWIVIVGALVAIGIGKMSFGGLGTNPFNPALVGRVFLLISFPGQMTDYPSPSPDAMSGATPLAFVKESLKSGKGISEIMPDLVSYQDMIIGFKGGSIGEIAAAALILGFIFLLWRKVITWHIPVVIVITMALFSGILNLADPERYINPLFHILNGGTLLGAIYMATDYVTSPMVKKAMVIYAIGIGLITILIRVFGAYPEGMSFAILIMNAIVPLLNKYIKPKRFGEVVKK